MIRLLPWLAGAGVAFWLLSRKGIELPKRKPKLTGEEAVAKVQEFVQSPEWREKSPVLNRPLKEYTNWAVVAENEDGSFVVQALHPLLGPVQFLVDAEDVQFLERGLPEWLGLGG